MTDQTSGECINCEQPISKDTNTWLHDRYSTRPNDDLRQCMLYASPKS